MILLALAFFLAVQCGRLVVGAEDVVKGAVIDWSHHYEGIQIRIPSLKVKEPKAALIKLETPSKKQIVINCREYENDSPRAFVYTQEGVLIDILVLLTVDNVCTKISSYISPGEPKKIKQSQIIDQTLEMTYLMAGKKPRCIKRKYTTTEYFYMAVVERGDFPRVECPGLLKQAAETGITSGGAVNLGPIGIIHLFDYNANVEQKGDIYEIDFQNDFRDKWFKLACREDTIKKEDKTYTRNKVTKAIIQHEKYERLVLDKYLLDRCSTNYINVNRRIIFGKDVFKVVFKTVEGKCFERIIEPTKHLNMVYYEQVTFNRGAANKVRCPKLWVGDIGLNDNIPWYLKFLFSPTKYSVEMSLWAPS